MSRKTVVGLFAVLLGLAGAGVYLGLTSASGPGTAGGPAGDDGAAAGVGDGAAGPGSLAIPAATVPFRTLTGDTVSLRSLRGRVVVLNLWGTWCPPCREEIPHLVDLQERIEPRGGTVVGLAVDSGTPEEIRDFIDDFAVNYPIWRGTTQTVVEHYEAVGFPTTLIIDREGIIRERYLGPQSADDLLAGLEPFLAQG